jgi:hypothetical protein
MTFELARAYLLNSFSSCQETAHRKRDHFLHLVKSERVKALEVIDYAPRLALGE